MKSGVDTHWGPTLEIRILGPFQLSGTKGAVYLRSRRQRTVLAMLALNANRVVTVDQLVDAVWGAHPPSTPRTQIQICVSGLRKTLRTIGCTARITTLDPGYVLEIDGAELDRHVFDRLIRSAQAHEAASRLDEAVGSLRSALALWRGPALTDVPGEVIGAAARRLDERRVTADGERLRLELAMGRHAEIIPDLRDLVDENPMREELYATLMLALYRTGRQSEALEAFREARAVLVEEVGIEPSERLRGLERAILNRDRALEGPRTAPPPQVTASEVGGQLPAGIADFTSRETSLAEIRSLLSTGHGDPAGFLPIVGLSGRGGIGKSSLAVQAAHMLGDSFPDGQLYANLQGSRHDQTGDVLARFLRALGVPAAAIPDSLVERVELYRGKLTGRRILVVLDNVVDEHQVLPLLPGVPRCGVIVTSRSGLSALSGARWIHLDGLDHEQSLALLTRQLGEGRVAGEREAAAELVRRCGGLPLALRIAAARLIARPHLRVADFVALLTDEDRRLDELSHGGLELRATIGSSYEALPEDARRLLRRLSVIESAEFPGWAAAALLDTGVRQGWALAESLVDAGMLDAVVRPASGSVRYRFPDFVRAFARERLEALESPAARAEATRRWLGGLLSQIGQAHHVEHGDGYPVQPSTAPRWAPAEGWTGLGGDRPASPDFEHWLFTSAMRRAADIGFDDLCWAMALVEVSLVDEEVDAWRKTAATTLTVARCKGDIRAEAAMLYSLGMLDLGGQRLATAQQLLGSALALFESGREIRGWGLALRGLLRIDRMRGDLPAMRERFRTALVVTSGTTDPIDEVYTLISLAREVAPGAEAEARSLFERAIGLSRAARCPHGEAQALHGLGEAALRLGDPDEAAAALDRALPIMREVGDRAGEARARHLLGLAHSRQGRLQPAADHFTHALELTRQLRDSGSEGLIRYRLAELHLRRGDPAAALEDCGAALRIFDRLGLAKWRAWALELILRIRADAGGPTPDDEQLTMIAQRTNPDELRVASRVDRVMD